VRSAELETAVAILAAECIDGGGVAGELMALGRPLDVNIQALRKLIDGGAVPQMDHPEEIVEHLSDAKKFYLQRSQVVHGSWLVGTYPGPETYPGDDTFPGGSDDGSYDAIRFRTWGTQDTSSWSAVQLEDLAARIDAIIFALTGAAGQLRRDRHADG